MGLDLKYDERYRTTLAKELIDEIVVNAVPKNRFEAIVAAGGDGNTLLDIGCGSGRLLYQFRNRFQKLLGLEFSRHRLAQAEVNLAGLNFVPINGSAEDMSVIESDSVDQIISADTIEHIPDVYQATKEMYRILKPGGRLVINTPNIASMRKRVILLFGRFPATAEPNEGIGDDIMFDGGHLHYFTFRSLRVVLERAGFTVIKRMGYGRYGLLTEKWPTLWSGGVQLIARK